MKRLVMCAAILLAGMCLQAREKQFEDRVNADGASSLVIKHAHGNITVRGWDKDEVFLKGVKIATGSYSEDLDEIRVELSRQGNKVMVELIRPSRNIRFGWGKLKVNYELFAPRNLSVQAGVAHGNTSLAGMDGQVLIDGAHGNFEGEDLGGNLIIEWAHGASQIVGVDGNLNLTSRHGNSNVTGVAGDLVVDSAHGSFTGKHVDGAVSIEASHGKVLIANNHAPEHPYVISTSHGSVTLDLPQNSGIDLEVDVAHGSINSQHGLDVRKKGNRASVDQRLNSGGVSVTIAARHGSVKVM